MLSAFITPARGYSAMPLAEQLMHRWCVRPGPLVLRSAPLKSPSPTTDRDRTVSRRSEPSSRTTLIGGQPNPWDLLQAPGCDEPTSRCQTSPVDVNSWGDQPVIPRVAFYPLSDGISTHYHLITNSYFRTCSTCWSRSQPGFYVYTHCAISVRAEPSFERLRYSFGGDRPSQTAHLTVSPARITGAG